MELIANGTLWYYESYDHKRAIEEVQQKYPKSKIHKNEPVPNDIKRNHIVWRIGKLRTMMFDPDGMIKKMYIGRSFKYAKCFFPEQVGETVKPIINVKTDKLGLIKAQLAVDESSL